MLLDKINIFITTICLALPSLAGVESLSDQIIVINGQPLKAKDVVKDIVRLAKNREPQYLSPRYVPLEYGEVPARNDAPSEICIECEDMTKFTTEISDIILKYNETSPTRDDVELKQETFKLKAVLEYTKLVNKDGQATCLTDAFISEEAFYRPELFEDFELLFTSEIDMSQFQSMTISDNSHTQQRITWFRAKDDQDKDIFIKVVNLKEGNSYFQVYHPGSNFVDPRPRDIPLPSLDGNGPKEEKIPRKRELSYIDNQTFDTSIGTVTIDKALHVKQEYYVPTRLTLISMTTESRPTQDTTVKGIVDISDRDQEIGAQVDTKLTEELKLRTQVEVTPSGQGLDMQLDVRGKRRITARLEDDGTYRAGVFLTTPQFRNFDFDTNITYDSNRTARIDNNFRFNGSTIVQTATMVDESGHVNFHAGRSIEVFDNATVTMQLRHGDRDDDVTTIDGTSAYLGFDMRF